MSREWDIESNLNPTRNRTLNRQISTSYAFSLSSGGLDGKPNYYEVPMSLQWKRLAYKPYWKINFLDKRE